MIDLTPRALLHRLERGVVYSREKADRAIKNFFRESTLVALRELALRQAAHEVGQRMVDQAAPRTEDPLEAARRKHHRILIHITSDPHTAMLIRRAKRVSDFINAECFAVAIQSAGDLSTLSEHDRDAIKRHLNFARNLHIETRILEGEACAAGLVDFARRNQITQIFLTRPPERHWAAPLSRNLVQEIAAIANDMQIVIVSGHDRVKY